MVPARKPWQHFLHTQAVEDPGHLRPCVFLCLACVVRSAYWCALLCFDYTRGTHSSSRRRPGSQTAWVCRECCQGFLAGTITQRPKYADGRKPNEAQKASAEAPQSAQRRPQAPERVPHIEKRRRLCALRGTPPKHGRRDLWNKIGVACLGLFFRLKRVLLISYAMLCEVLSADSSKCGSRWVCRQGRSA